MRDRCDTDPVRTELSRAVIASSTRPDYAPNGTKIWSLMQLKRQLRPEAYSQRRGGYLDRRQTPAADA